MRSIDAFAAASLRYSAEINEDYQFLKFDEFTWNDHRVKSRIFSLFLLEFLYFSETQAIVLLAERMRRKRSEAFLLRLVVVTLVQLRFLHILNFQRVFALAIFILSSRNEVQNVDEV